jgi:hypothetical protein
MKRLLALILVLVIAISTLTSCAQLGDVLDVVGEISDAISSIIANKFGEPQVHECESICETCGKCTDKNCTEDACEDKCQGHSTAPEHECESVCPSCGKCTDKNCTEDACEDKCQGHTATSTTVSKDYHEIAAGAGATSNGDVVGGNIKLDNVITVTFAQGTAANPPALYTESIRMYQNGATLTIKANGSYITKVVITLADHDSGKGPISVKGGTASALTNLKYTITANANTS